MIDMHSKYDNMHTNEIFNAIISINNHVNSCINCMLLVSTTAYDPTRSAVGNGNRGMGGGRVI